MANFTIEIKAPQIAEAIIALAEAVKGINLGLSKVNTQVVKDETFTAEMERGQIVDETPSIEPEVIQPIVQPVSKENAIDIQVESVHGPKKYTLEEVRAKLTELTRAGKTAQVKAIIQEAGASKLTEIAEEKYAEVMEKALEL